MVVKKWGSTLKLLYKIELIIDILIVGSERNISFGSLVSICKRGVDKNLLLM